MRLLKIIFVLVVVSGLGLVGYAYLGDLRPDQSEFRQQIDLDAE